MFASSSSNNIHKCHKKQSEALLLLKHDLSPTSYTSYSYPITMNWNTSTDCCIWNGVTCDRSTGDVIGIDVSNGRLSGTIRPNSSLFNLPRLQTLNLAHNDFDAFEIPSEIGSLNISSSFLKLLNLFNTGLQGTLPHYIFNLQSLETLALPGNHFTGDIPSKISVNLTHLTSMDLTTNKLNGTLPSWLFTSPSLEYLYLDDNMFTGNVPFESFALPSLKRRSSTFAGQLPTKYFQNFDSMKNVVKNNTEPQYLYMAGGKGIPEIIGNLSALKVLNLSHNSLYGRIPDSLGKLSEIESLDLSSNQLTGNIPQSLAGIKGLEVLNLSQNHLVGAYTREHSSKHLMRAHLQGIWDSVGFHCLRSVVSVHTSRNLKNMKIMRRKVDLRGKCLQGAYDFRAKQEKICIYWEMTARLFKRSSEGLGPFELCRRISASSELLSAADVDFGDIDFSNHNMEGGEGFDAEGDEDDSDTKEEVKEEEGIGKQEVAPPVSNQVEATT
ncbi:leucine-rich repeat-containing protein [Tanacetum coccineum]